MNANPGLDPRGAILAGLPIALLAFDGQDRLTLANAALHALAGTDPAALPSGLPRGETLRRLAFRGLLGCGDPEARAAAAPERGIANGGALRMADGRRLEWLQAPLPDGGLVIALPETSALAATLERTEREVHDLHAVLQRLTAGVALYDGGHRLRFTNAAYPGMVGLTPALTHPGAVFQDLLQAQIARGEFAPLSEAEVMERVGSPANFLGRSVERQRPNGDTLRFRNHPMPDGGWLAEVTDITAERRAEQEARHRVALQDALFDALPVGVAVYGPDRVLRYVNPAYNRILSHTPVQVGEHLRDILMRRALAGEFGPCDPAQEVAKRVTRVTEPVSFERTRETGQVTVHQSTPLPDGGHAMVVADVSALNAAQAEARARAEMLATTLESTRHGIAMFDADGRVIIANRLAAHFCGLPPERFAPGVHVSELRALQLAAGVHGDSAATGRFLADRITAPLRGPDRYRRTARDGSVVEVITDPLPSGGFVRSYSDVTALARAEAEANARAATLQTVLDTMRHGVILYDGEGHVRVANALAGQLAGLPVEALRPGIHFDELRDIQVQRGEHGPGEAGEAYRRHRPKEPWKGEGTYIRRRPDGTVIEVRTDVIPGGGCVRSFTDITVLAAAQAEVASRNAMMQAMLDNMRHGIVMLDAEMRLAAANRLAGELLGLEGALRPGATREELIALQLARGEFGPPDQAAELARRTLALDWSRPQSYRRRRPNGTEVEIYTNPVPGGGYVLTVTDITDRVRAEEEAQRRAGVLAAALNASRHTITLYDAERRIIATNRMAAAVAGYESEQAMLGLTLDDILRRQAVYEHPDDPALQQAFLERYLNLDRTEAHRYQRRHPDGRVFDVQSEPTPDGGFAVSVADVTALVNAQEEAQRRAGVLQAMLDNNRHGIVLYDAQHRLVAANGLAGEMMGVADLLRRPGTPHAEILAAQRARGMYADGQGGAATERGFRDLDRSAPQRMQRTLPDGRRFDIASDPTPDGGFVVSIADVTQLVRAEAEAERRAGVLQTMLDNISMGILLYDRDRRLIAVNDLAATTLGVPDLAEMRGSPMEEVLARQFAAGNFGEGEEAARVHRTVRDQDRSVPQFHQRITRDGRVLNNASHPTPDGGFVVSIADVTPLAQAQAEAARRAEILGVMLGNIRHGIALFDGRGRLVACNPKLREMLELPADFMRPGLSMREMVNALQARGEYGPGEEGAAVAAAILARPRAAPVRSVRSRPDGSIVEVVSDPTPDGGFVVTYTDVTEDRRIREALERARAEAEAANLAKSRFLATMSHELRTPLNAVIGFSEVLRGDAPAQQTEEFALAIQEAGRHLLSLIDDILDVTRAESGHLPVSLGPVTPAAMLASVERMMREMAERAGLGLELAAVAGLPAVRADDRRLRQVLLNLVANAVKFTPAGGRITLDARRDAEGLVIEVRDTGIGIAAADLQKVFEPFTQLDSQLARRYPGAGLGLYLCRVLMEAQGGSLTLESHEGEGTRALLRFPASALLPAA
ncbi:MAG: PAS-domain containing protein [Rubritepida sp.]|nr:PAS-domain containing protein [Rubritepida sp.]